MKLFKSFLLRSKQEIYFKKDSNQVIDKYDEIAKLVKEARIQKNISIEELSTLSKIPKYLIVSIENNVENIRPKYPFIRSILGKLEECLSLQKDQLVGLLIKEIKTPNKGKKKFILRKLDFINTWQGIVLYLLILILTIFILKRYFFSNVSIIEIQNTEEKLKIK